jgi:two-component system response regulator HydG
VRELKNAVERVALLCESHQVSAADLAEIVGPSPRQRSRELERLARAVLAMEHERESKLELLERVMLSQALDLCQGNKSAAARLMGVDRKALERRWSRLSEPPQRDGDA